MIYYRNESLNHDWKNLSTILPRNKTLKNVNCLPFY